MTSNSSFSSAAAAAARHRRRSRDGDRRGGRDAPLLFEHLRQLGGLEDRQVGKFFDDFFEICSHLSFLLRLELVLTGYRLRRPRPARRVRRKHAGELARRRLQ